MINEYVEKLEKAELLGKGGAAFPTGDKWRACGEAESDINLKYIICNSSEGELGLFKDLYIWRNHMDRVFKGIEYGLKFLGNAEVYIHINSDYLKELEPQLFKYINDYKWQYKFHISIENPCYIGGEASALMNIIETGIAQPKPRTTRTTVKGLFMQPTMMQNVETFKDIADILDGVYENKRFSGVFGDGIEKKFTAHHKIDATIAEILKENNINPDFDYYVQVGGSASGLVYDQSQLNDVIMSGAGAIEIFDKSKRNALVFLKRLCAFYEKEACGKCKGKEFAKLLNEKVQAIQSLEELKIEELMSHINDMGKKTFCKLCKSIKKPILTYYKNVLNIDLEPEEVK